MKPSNPESMKLESDNGRDDQGTLAGKLGPSVHVAPCGTAMFGEKDDFRWRRIGWHSAQIISRLRKGVD